MTHTLQSRQKSHVQEASPLAPGRGGCIASDMIIEEGLPVCFMYREQPENDLDSGWRFVTGLESEEYMADASNHAFCDCETIAAIDPDVAPLLDAPVGVIFERDEAGQFVEVLDFVVPKE